jgi:hypothetical protein
MELNKKQKYLALLFMESEFIAFMEITKEGEWLLDLFVDFNITNVSNIPYIVTTQATSKSLRTHCTIPRLDISPSTSSTYNLQKTCKLSKSSTYRLQNNQLTYSQNFWEKGSFCSAVS